MSESEIERAKIRKRVGGGLDADIDDDGVHGGGGSSGSSERKNQIRGCGFGGDFTKAKAVFLLPCTKAKRLLLRHRRRPSSSSSSDYTGKRTIGSCFCFKQPSSLESSAESVTSDPNDPNFTSGMLRNLIETNDFYSKECNPHLDNNVRPSFSSD